MKIRDLLCNVSECFYDSVKIYRTQSSDTPLMVGVDDTDFPVKILDLEFDSWMVVLKPICSGDVIMDEYYTYIIIYLDR